MPEKISYQFDSNKFANAVAYLCSNLGTLTKLKVVKLLYFADRLHLQKYGRPIIGDRYHKVKNGPIPSRALDIINGKKHDPNFESTIEADRSDNRVRMREKNAPYLDIFSDSDLEVLNSVIKSHGGFTAGELIEESHEHATWKETPKPKEIDYRLFLEGLPSNKKKLLIELMEQDQEDRVLLKLS